jgi:hypothetical protein
MRPTFLPVTVRNNPGVRCAVLGGVCQLQVFLQPLELRVDAGDVRKIDLRAKKRRWERSTALFTKKTARLDSISSCRAPVADKVHFLNVPAVKHHLAAPVAGHTKSTYK